MTWDKAQTTAGFFEALPSVDSFERVADLDGYRALPDGWEIGLADVEASSAAIASGRYKAVNMAGAAAISAVSNALGTLSFPFVFTGDGMAYAVGPDRAAEARAALAATLPWVSQGLGLTLRGAVVSTETIRAAGHDVRVARYAPSTDVSYAMFAGGGLLWGEEQLKADLLPKLATSPDRHPDLRGLSCRFQPLGSRRGLILSLIVTPRAAADPQAVRMFIDRLVAEFGSDPDAGRPLDSNSLRLSNPVRTVRTEARLLRGAHQSKLSSFVRTSIYTAFVAFVLRLDRSFGSFSPQRYRDQIVANSDFRKYEDGLMMTLDCSASFADRIERTLADARSRGLVDFGLHRQNEALITCVVPSPTRADHIHLIDGADGGYTAAASALKRSRAASQLPLGT